MVLEIIGALYLAKDFGSSFYVWISQIGVIMVALAVGYAVGGGLADRYQRAGFLSILLLPTGVVTILIPEYATPIINAIVNRHPLDRAPPAIWQKLDPAMGSAVFFLLPCIVLAMLPPYVIRLLSRQLSQVGRISGRVYAASTVGSIAGVIISGYVLIDNMGLSGIIRLMGSVTVGLGLLCLVMDFLWKSVRKEAPAPATVAKQPIAQQLLVWVVLLIALGLTTGNARAAITYETTSAYHHIRVLDNDKLRTLSFNGSQETRMSLLDNLKGHFEYTEYFHMPWLWNTNIQSVLMIGLGGGSTVRSYQHYYPTVAVEVVELDPAVIKVARDYFYVKETPTLKIHQEDGRVHLRRSQKKFDLIILDAYSANRYGSYIPYQLATKEFFKLANDHMTEDGVLAYNVIGTMRGWQVDIMGALYKTMGDVFPQVYCFPAQDSLNVVLLATKSPERWNKMKLTQETDKLVRSGRVKLATFKNRAWGFMDAAPNNAKQAKVLTDDRAPVGGLLMRAGE